jgi:hypothetical protein
MSSEATPTHWITYGEAPLSFTPAHDRILARLSLDRNFTVACERRAAPDVSAAALSANAASPGLRIIPTAMPIRPPRTIFNTATTVINAESTTIAKDVTSATTSADSGAAPAVRSEKGPACGNPLTNHGAPRLLQPSPESATAAMAASFTAIATITAAAQSGDSVGGTGATDASTLQSGRIIPAALLKKRSRSEKIYAVLVGRQPGLFTTWAECKASVDGFKSARHQAFGTEAAARAYLAANGIDPDNIPKPPSTNKQPLVSGTAECRFDSASVDHQSNIMTVTATSHLSSSSFAPIVSASEPSAACAVAPDRGMSLDGM